jgi:hypothetical protein
MGWDGEGEFSSRANWDQGGQDSTTQRRDSKSVRKGQRVKGLAKGIDKGR